MKPKSTQLAKQEWGDSSGHEKGDQMLCGYQLFYSTALKKKSQ